MSSDDNNFEIEVDKNGYLSVKKKDKNEGGACCGCLIIFIIGFIFWCLQNIKP